MKVVTHIIGYLVAGFGLISLLAAWRLSGHSLSDFAFFTGIAFLILGGTISRTVQGRASPKNPTRS